MGCGGTSHDNYAQQISDLGGEMHVHVDLGGTAITDEDLMSLDFPDTLRSISLRDSSISDAGAEELMRGQNIEQIDLTNTQITDASLDALMKLPRLHVGDVASSDITPEAFGKFRFFISDRIPSISNRSSIYPFPRLPPVKEGQQNAEEEPLPETEKLSGYANDVEYYDGELQVYLALENTSITDADLASIPLPENIRGISLRGTAITDDGLRELLRARNLEFLDLRNTQITDDGIDTLRKLSRLRQALVGSTKVSEKGERYLKAGLAKQAPNIKYDYSRAVESAKTKPE